MLFISQSNEEQAENDNMCNLTRGILCVNDVLNEIAATTENLNQTINEIKKHILRNASIVDKIIRYVKFQMQSIDSQIPTLKYHMHFFRMSNIDKKFLVELFFEAHNTMSFYYNSINDIINMHDLSSWTTDVLLKHIQKNLKYEIICQYRNILNVYSHEWKSINEINRIKFLLIHHETTRSIIHDVHTIVTVQLLSEWMQKIHLVINNLKTKFV